VLLNPNAQNIWFLDAPQTGEGDEVDPRTFCECAKWKGCGNLLVPNVTGVPARFALGEFDYPVVEASLGAAIAEVDSEVQLVPLSVVGRSGTHVILNLLRSLECINEEASEFDTFTVTGSRPDLAGQYKTFYRLRLHPTLVPKNVHIFRVARYEVAMIVSQAMKELLMEKGGDDGIAFVRVT
jgi:hypothetical protein